MVSKTAHTIVAVSWPDCGVGNDPVPLGLAFHHRGSTFLNAYCQAAMNLSMHVVKPLQTWLIETESNIGLMIYLWPRRSALSECFKMVPLIFVFSICYRAFMCNAVCDLLEALRH